MPKASLWNMKGERLGEVDLPGSIFGAEVKRSVLHSAVRMYLDRKRLGTASTKTRAEVRGGGRKPWRQKGTGWARHGSIRSPIWRKGGIVFGPKPRDYAWSLPRKMKRLALRSALSAKAARGKVAVVEGLRLESPKTKEVFSMLRGIGAERSALIVLARRDENVLRSARNIPGTDVTVFKDLNAYDVLAHDAIVLSRDALDEMAAESGAYALSEQGRSAEREPDGAEPAAAEGGGGR